MSTALIGEMPGSPTGTLGTDSISFERRWRVDSDSFNDGPILAISAVGLDVGSSYSFGNESFGIARLKEFSAERIQDNSKTWIVTAQYEAPDSQDEEEEEENQNPLLDPPKIDLDGEQSTEPVRFTISQDSEEIFFVRCPNGCGISAGSGLVNSAGQRYKETPVRDISYPVLTIQRNESLSSSAVSLTLYYANAVNSDTFWGAPPGMVRCRPFKISKQSMKLQEGGFYNYLSVTYSFEFRTTDPFWQLELLDYGDYYLDSTSGAKVRFSTEDGQPVEGLLDGNGGELPENDPEEYIGPFKIYGELPFSLLGLPQSFG